MLGGANREAWESDPQDRIFVLKGSNPPECLNDTPRFLKVGVSAKIVVVWLMMSNTSYGYKLG